MGWLSQNRCAVCLGTVLFAATFGGSLNAADFIRGNPFSLRKPEKLPAPDGRVHRLDGEILLHNGTGLQRRFIFKIYELSLFVKERSQSAKEILASRTPKFVEMKFKREMDSAQIVEGFREMFNESCKSSCSKLSPFFEKLLLVIPDVQDGSIVSFTFYPDRLRVKSKSDELEILSAEFSDFLLRLWLGENPPSARLQEGMLGLR